VRLWQDITRAKYVHNKPISSAQHIQGADLLKFKHFYPKNKNMRVGNGEATSFWDDASCTSIPFKKIYSTLFDICNEQKISVSEANSLNR
jgi:hypothetical protein